jgi:hypothetical protein
MVPSINMSRGRHVCRNLSERNESGAEAEVFSRAANILGKLLVIIFLGII